MLPSGRAKALAVKISSSACRTSLQKHSGVHTLAFRIAADLLFPEPSRYSRDPAGWATGRLGEFWWSGQHRMARSVVENRYSAFKASHDVSKSHTMSRLALWWIDVHPPGEAFVVTTAPTTPQVEAILWRYMGNAHRKAGLPGRITLDAKWYIGNELVAYGRKPADYDPAAFQGIHARYVLVIIDEAGGVPKSIFDAVDALATNIDARVVAVGNPDDPASHFAIICKPGSGWHMETISAFDTPAYIGEKVPEELLPLLVSPEWVEERKLRWGITSPIYQSKVLGEFPDISDDSLILPKWIEAAQKRTLPRTRRPIIAADIARFGEDETVIMRREGGWIRVYRAHHKADTMTTAGHIAKAMRDIDSEKGLNDWVRAVVDVPGVGGGVVDCLAELELPVTPYNGGEAPIDKERFVNARAEDYWTLREMFEQDELDIDPDDDNTPLLAPVYVSKDLHSENPIEVLGKAWSEREVKQSALSKLNEIRRDEMSRTVTRQRDVSRNGPQLDTSVDLLDVPELDPIPRMDDVTLDRLERELDPRADRSSDSLRPDTAQRDWQRPGFERDFHRDIGRDFGLER